MKPVVKKIIIGTTVLLGLAAYFAYTKFMQLKAIFDKIEISAVNARSFKFSLTDIRFLVDIKFLNPTADDFEVKGYVIELNRLNFFYNGTYLATAKSVFNEINVPRNNELIIQNIPVILPTANLVKNALLLSSFDKNKLTVEAVISAGGNEYLIN
jgi:hypothetical protein